MNQLSVQSSRVLTAPSGQWSSQEALALAARYDIDDPAEAAVRVVKDLMDQIGSPSIPTDLLVLGSWCGVVDVIRVPLEVAGLVELADDGYLIKLNRDETRSRQRFTHAHEIGHILIDRDINLRRRQIDEDVQRYTLRDEEEYLCDLMASEILMPEDTFGRRCQALPLGLETVLQLSEEFGASLESTAIRYASIGRDKCAIIVWEKQLTRAQARERRIQPAFSGMEHLQVPAQLRIRLVSKSPSFATVYFPSEASTAGDTTIDEALNASSIVNGISDLPIGGGHFESFYSEAIAAPYFGRGQRVDRVISLIREP